jgi:predicted DCC family thiol-disulfide oxidoreductase YuxK
VKLKREQEERGKSLLIYDAECAPCSKFKHLIDWLDKYNRLDYISLARADFLGILNPVPFSQRHRSFHLILPPGEILSGSRAIPNLLSLLPLGKVVVALIYKIPIGEKIVNFVYSTLSRLHDSGSCSYRPSAISFVHKDNRKEEKGNGKNMSPLLKVSNAYTGFASSR